MKYFFKKTNLNKKLKKSNLLTTYHILSLIAVNDLINIICKVGHYSLIYNKQKHHISEGYKINQIHFIEFIGYVLKAISHVI